MGIQERIKIHLCFVADIHVLGLLKGSVTVFCSTGGPTNTSLEFVLQ